MIFVIPSLFAAMAIAGAFWVGVLAARRLKDWGDGQRALEDGEGGAPLALAPAGHAPSGEGAVRRVREAVAQRLHHGRESGSGVVAKPAERDASELDLGALRCGDIVVAELGEAGYDGDYVTDGILRIREGNSVRVVAILADGETRRWLVGELGASKWMLVKPVQNHGLSGEPPRNLDSWQREGELYSLERRGQGGVAGVGRHGRPAQNRVGYYLYRASNRHVVWLERWGREVFVGEGVVGPRHSFSFLPGS